jgi:hypothetical protein
VNGYTHALHLFDAAQLRGLVRVRAAHKLINEKGKSDSRHAAAEQRDDLRREQGSGNHSWPERGVVCCR